MAIKNFYTGVYIGDNLGIGTTSPNASLHILSTGNGEVEVERASGALINMQAQSAKGLIGTDSNHTFSLKTNSSERLTILNSGLVGIGTTSPGLKLDINSGTANSALRVLSTDRYTGIKFEDATNSDTLFYDGQSDLMYLSSTNFRAVDIYATGDVGIGTTTPRAKLDVAGGVKVADDTDTASLNKVGTLRYRYVPGSPKNFSYVDMCMQTGTSSYAWVNIVQNVWN
jgi:hypothetical protein